MGAEDDKEDWGDRDREEGKGAEREMLLLLELQLDEVASEACERRRSSRLSWLSPEELLPLLMLLLS